MKRTISYRVKFRQHPEFNAIYRFTLEKSGCFNYGNGTCVVLTVNGERKECIDTRYIKELPESFNEWCDTQIRNIFDADFEPHIEKL